MPLAAINPLPKNLSFEEGATLPCVGVTAWNGLFTRGRIQTGDYVLLEGTGGVSTFVGIFKSTLGITPGQYFRQGDVPVAEINVPRRNKVAKHAADLQAIA